VEFVEDSRLGGDEVAEGVGGVVAAGTILVVGIGFEDVFGMVGVVNQIRQAINEAATAFVNEEAGRDAVVGVAQ
jgi:hypothetical protein